MDLEPPTIGALRAVLADQPDDAGIAVVVYDSDEPHAAPGLVHVATLAGPVSVLSSKNSPGVFISCVPLTTDTLARLKANMLAK